MPKAPPLINREISWLSFNERVLQEAADASVPLLERIKFLGIFSSNLDEFFRVRVGTLYRMLDAGKEASAVLGASPKKILSEIQKTVLKQQKKFDDVFETVLEELKSEGITIINEQELTPAQEIFIQDYFFNEVRPLLVPVMLEGLKKFPELKNQIIYLAIKLYNTKSNRDKKFAIIELPADRLPRYSVLPGNHDDTFIIMLDDIIRFGLQQVFSIFEYEHAEAYTIKFTRDAEIDISDDITKSFFEKISKSIKSRKTGRPVRIVYDKDMPKDLLNFILDKTKLSGFDNIIGGGRYHNARDFINFPKVGRKNLRVQYPKPLIQPMLSQSTNYFNVLKERDILLNFPYQSFDYMVEFLRQAAIDPQVSSIKITVYRLAKNSKIINALINAVLNGKKVTVLLELQARFDEEANIYWTSELEDAGVRVIDGVPGLKVHAKLCLVTRNENKKNKYYATIGTGNFNEDTARIYTDHTLLTSNSQLTDEIRDIFKFFDNNYKIPKTKHIVMAPFQMRNIWLKHIKNEAKNAKAGKAAYIWIKLNSLVDMDLIKALYAASKAGVKIKIIARSISSIVPDNFDNIEVYSIVDMYLEHSRIFIFANNGQEKHYISSADWMVRNLDNRIEVAAPLYDEAVKKQLKLYMETQFRDINKSRILNGQLSNAFKPAGNENVIRAQIDYYKVLENELSKQRESS